MQRVNVIGKSRRAMADLIRADGVQVVRQTLRELDDGRFRVQAYGEADALNSLTQSGFTVEHVERVRTGPPTAAIPGPGRRGRGPGAGQAPDGYLSVDEVEQHIAELAKKHPRAVRLIELPHRTWEGRTSRAIRIGRGDEKTPAILLLGGLHAREWGSPDILIAFAERLLTAWSNEKGIAIGNRRFRASNIQRLIDETAIYILPQVNPDGRHHSFTVDAYWRKNRRPAPAERDGDETCIGVDLNRNFDFLWDFAKAFSPDAPVSCSTQPCDKEVYVGPAATSEPETRNVVWLLDEHPEIGYFIDLHSYGELIMYCWGDDENQTGDASMTFANGDWDGRRGVFDDSYREFLDDDDRQLLVRLGEAMAAGIAASRDHHYRVQQSANLYPTAGTSDDYSYSRHLVDPALAKVLAFTVEWGSEQNPTPFHPPYAEMKKIIAEMTSGLLAFCGEAARINAAKALQEVS
jgi:murein tripeptide amidase MpaA